MTDAELANIGRDARLRVRILRVLDNARPIALNGLQILDIINGSIGVQLEDDAHLLQLLTDLKNLGLIEIEDLRVLERDRLEARFFDAAVTAKGSRFVIGGEPADPLINDGRIVKRNASNP